MIRVTGSNSLIMSSIDSTSEVDLQNRADKLHNILTGKKDKEVGTIPPEYKELQNEVSKLKELADKLTGSSIWTEAEELGDTSEVTEMAKDFVEQYNSLLKALDNTETGEGYSKELSAIVSGNKDLLTKVGISVSDGGKLTIDEEVFSKASLDDLKKLFQGESSMAGKIADKSVYAGASAVAHAYMAMYGNSSNYNATGGMYDEVASIIGGYMDFMG